MGHSRLATDGVTQLLMLRILRSLKELACLCSMELNIGPVDWCPGIHTANVPTFADQPIDTLNQELAEPGSTPTLKLCNLGPEVRFVKFGSLVALSCS